MVYRNDKYRVTVINPEFVFGKDYLASEVSYQSIVWLEISDKDKSKYVLLGRGAELDCNKKNSLVFHTTENLAFVQIYGDFNVYTYDRIYLESEKGKSKIYCYDKVALSSTKKNNEDVIYLYDKSEGSISDGCTCYAYNNSSVYRTEQDNVILNDNATETIEEDKEDYDEYNDDLYNED